MKLVAVKLRNFRGYKSETVIELWKLTAFIWKNDAGKSSVMEALEIFFNNKLVVCERDDKNIYTDANDTNIEITCIFSEFPSEITIDSTSSTDLKSEYLLNEDWLLEIKKVFATTSKKPGEKVYIVCNHPSIKEWNDLIEMKITALKTRANELWVPNDSYNASISSSIRKAIWEHLWELSEHLTELLVDKEDAKKVYEALKGYLPIYALFQSDRVSKDDDKEVTDPMKIAVQQALSELTLEIEYIKEQVKERAIETANRTLSKLQEMSPDLANALIPEFKTEPKFDSQFKLSIESEEGIPINKRWSWVRRLILLNFFRAEAERLREGQQDGNIIFAFEEPETSQHPDHQKILIESFVSLASSDKSQIILTTHTPALWWLLPLNSLRFISVENNERLVESGNDAVFTKIADTLGVLPEPISKDATALLLVEWRSDVVFINHTSDKLKEGWFIGNTFWDKRIAIVPVGWCGNIKSWRTMQLATQFNIPYCVMLDSDKWHGNESNMIQTIADLHSEGIKAYSTQKRELENYIHLDCLWLPAWSSFSFSATCDAKQLIAQEKSSSKRYVIEDYWTSMTVDQIREVEKYQEWGEDKYEFTEMFQDFLSLVD